MALPALPVLDMKRLYEPHHRGACMSKAPSSAKGAALEDDGGGYFQETTAELTVVESVGR